MKKPENEVMNEAVEAARTAATAVLTDAGLLKRKDGKDLLFSCIITTKLAQSTSTMLAGSYVLATRAYIKLMHDLAINHLNGDFSELLNLKDGICKLDHIAIDQLADITKGMLTVANPMAKQMLKEAQEEMKKEAMAEAEEMGFSS